MGHVTGAVVVVVVAAGAAVVTVGAAVVAADTVASSSNTSTGARALIAASIEQEVLSLAVQVQYELLPVLVYR